MLNRQIHTLQLIWGFFIYVRFFKDVLSSIIKYINVIELLGEIKGSVTVRYSLYLYTAGY